MAKQVSNGIKLATPKKKRPGVHAKSSTSKIKTSKNYKKPYRSQGH
jgi:hypothetical protein